MSEQYTIEEVIDAIGQPLWGRLVDNEDKPEVKKYEVFGYTWESLSEEEKEKAIKICLETLAEWLPVLLRNFEATP